MKAAPLILLSVGLAAGASVATTYFLRPGPRPALAADGVAPDEFDVLRTRIADLSAELTELRSQTPEAGLPSTVPNDRVSMSAIDSAVQRYFQEHFPGLSAEGSSGEESQAAAQIPGASAAELAELLRNPDLGSTERQEIWERLRESGQLDEAIALLEARAENFSDDPDAQVEVAAAYIQKIFDVGEGPQAGVWAGKADMAFDRALALDDQHWDARFDKAVSLSFWPPIYGKQNEAISHFELLIGQQEGRASEDRFSQTYLLLGNLYAQGGDIEKAKATWNKGLSMFPTDEDLLEKFSDQ